MIQRYSATTLGGGNDYCLEPDEDGTLCVACDVEKLELTEAALRDIVQAQDCLLAIYRMGGYSRADTVLTKLEKARKTLRNIEDD